MEKGIVVKSTGSQYTVEKDGGTTVVCRLKGRLRTEGIKSTSPVAVGDRVVLDGATIASVEPRRNYIIRKATKLSKQSHILAANVDMAFLTVTLRLPETPSEFIDRFLVAAEAYRIPVCIIFNKIDLLDPSERDRLHVFGEIYREIGYQTLETSAVDSSGIDSLRCMMTGKVSVVAGLSGAGKSSLINAVCPELRVRVGAMSDYHQSGKHTTTFAEMHRLQMGGYIIDTPGIRGFGLIHIAKEELYHFFPEMFAVSAGCAYYNCQHISEPGCAVSAAVHEGKISESRYRSYLNMMEDAHNKYRY